MRSFLPFCGSIEAAFLFPDQLLSWRGVLFPSKRVTGGAPLFFFSSSFRSRSIAVSAKIDPFRRPFSPWFDVDA